MATALQNASVIFDALADYRGVTLTGAQKEILAREFTDQVDNLVNTNEEIADLFLLRLFQHIREQGRYNARKNKKTELEPQVFDAEEAAESNL